MLPETKKILDAFNTDLNLLSSIDEKDYPYYQVRSTYLTALATIVVAAATESLVETLKNLDSSRNPTNKE